MLGGTPAPAVTQSTETAHPSISAEGWRDDLDVVVGLVTRLHPNPFHTVSRDAFMLEAAHLREAIPDLPDYRIMAGFARLVASIGDGHTRVNLAPTSPGVPKEASSGFVRLPLRLQWFSDGLFVRSASDELAQLAGGRVVEIGRLPVDEACGGSCRSYTTTTR